MPTISLKVDERTKSLMDLHDEINWSAVLRKSLEQRLAELNKPVKDSELAKRALKDADEIRKKYKSARPAEEIVREWRDKRRL